MGETREYQLFLLYVAQFTTSDQKISEAIFSKTRIKRTIYKRSPCIKRKNGTACFKSFFESIFSAKGPCTVDAFIGGHKRRSHACPVITDFTL